ncbi:hypothetical protein SprV_0100126600 [Sparganum proliferum]
MLLTKAIPGADGWAAHRRDIYNVRICLQPRGRPQGKGPSGKLNTASLSLPDHHFHSTNELGQRFANPLVAAATADQNVAVENRWFRLQDTVQSADLAVLGRARGQHQEWLDGNGAAISKLLADKNHLHKAYLNRPTNDNKAALYRSCRLIQQRLREMQDT